MNYAQILTTNINKNIFSSNNILAIEYLQALKKYNSKIELFLIKRINNSYNSKILTNKFSSAMSIRNNILNDRKKYTLLYKTIPENICSIYSTYLKKYKPVFLDNFNKILSYILYSITPGQLGNIAGINEGLEYKFLKESNKNIKIRELLSQIKSKRYIYTRLQRIIINILLNINKDILSECEHYGPQYIRPLAWNSTGQNLLKIISKKASLPLIVNTAKYIKQLDTTNFGYLVMNLEIKATKIYSIESGINPLEDFLYKPIII